MTMMCSLARLKLLLRLWQMLDVQQYSSNDVKHIAKHTVCA
jgi:hypothetical protein